MKKKITALCLCVALLAIAVVGVSLAYLTDTDKAVNTFTVGNIDVVLSETCKVTDSNNKEIEGAVTTDKNGVTSFTGLVPSYQITKTPVITNEKDSNEAYVRVAVVMNNKDIINQKIDNIYENSVNPATNEKYTDAEIQAIYDNIFNGWGMVYTKSDSERVRLWINDSARTGYGTQLIAIDMASAVYDKQEQFSATNMFTNDSDKKFLTGSDAGKKTYGSFYTEPGYYHNALLPGDTRVYVYYLKLQPGESYKLFNGLNIPADFTADQMKMFNNLKIGIYADAIQSAGFATAEEAFTALEEEHPLGWWRS